MFITNNELAQGKQLVWAVPVYTPNKYYVETISVMPRATHKIEPQIRGLREERNTSFIKMNNKDSGI